MATAPLKTVVPAAKFAPEIKSGNVVKAMTAAAATGAKGTPFLAPIDTIRVMDDFNVRVTGTPSSEEAMAELVQSILANGFYPAKPLSVFVAEDGDANVLYVKDGHRRFEAVQRANAIITANTPEGETPTLIAELPVIASPAASMSDMMIEVAQSATGAPLTMFEKGLLAKRLLDDNMTKEDIAAKLSMTERHLNNVLLLASAPAKLRDLIVTDKVTSTTGLKLMKDPKTAAAKATEMVKASEAKGKTKAAPKDSTTKMQSANSTFEFKAGASIKDTLKSLAEFVRANVGHDAEDSITAALGGVKITVTTPAPVAEPKPAKTPAAAKPAAAPKVKKVTTPKAAKSPAEAKAAAQAHLGGEKAADTGGDLAGL